MQFTMGEILTFFLNFDMLNLVDSLVAKKHNAFGSTFEVCVSESPIKVDHIFMTLLCFRAFLVVEKMKRKMC